MASERNSRGPETGNPEFVGSLQNFPISTPHIY